MTAEEELSELLSSTTLILIGVGLASVSTLVERVLIARLFSPDRFGEVSISIAIMTIGSAVALVGLNHGVPRYISRFDRKQDIRGTWIAALTISVLVSLAVVGVLIVNSGLLTEFLFDQERSGVVLVLFVLCIPAQVGLTIGLGALRGMENTRYKLYVKDVLYPVLRIGIFVLLVAGGFGLVAVGYAYLAATIVAFIGAHVLFNRLCSVRGGYTFHTRKLVSFSAPLVATMILSMALTQTDTLMVGYFRSSEEVGWYNAAYPLANSLLLVVSSFGYLYLPLTSRLDSDGKRGQVRDIYQITTKWAYIITFPAFVLLAFFSADVLALFFGNEYVHGGVTLTILSVGFFTSAALGRNRETLSALGYTKGILFAEILAFGLNVALNILLIPEYGIAGAATASAGAFISQNLAISGILYSKFDISPFSKTGSRTYLLLAVLLIPGTFIASRWISATLYSLPIILVSIATATVVIVVLTGCLDERDEALIEFIEQSIGIRVPFVHRYIPR